MSEAHQTLQAVTIMRVTAACISLVGASGTRLETGFKGKTSDEKGFKGVQTWHQAKRGKSSMRSAQTV